MGLGGGAGDNTGEGGDSGSDGEENSTTGSSWGPLSSASVSAQDRTLEIVRWCLLLLFMPGHNLEKVGPDRAASSLGPLASQAAQGTRDHQLSVILCLINPQMGWKPPWDQGPIRGRPLSGPTFSRLCAWPLKAEQAPPSPDYVPGPEHTDDEIVAEDQPVLEEDDDEDPEEDPVDYSADGRCVQDSERSSEKRVEKERRGMEEEEEHPAPADSVVVALPATDQAPSAEETEPSSTYTSCLMPEVARLALSTPPSSPLSPWSSPLPQIPSPSLPLSPPSPVLSPAPPPSPIRSLGYRAAMIRMRAEAASTSHSLPLPPPFILSPTRPDAPSLGIPPPLPISVPTSSPPLLLPSASRREDRPEVTLPPRKRLGIALGPGYEVGESSSAAAARPAGGLRADYGFVATMDREIRRDPEREVGYGITDSWDEIVETLQGAPVSTDTELGRHMTAFETRVRQDTDEIYTRLDDE
ncbi:hypothetical protein Tco_0653753 [Tanacetum coccineum]|uniref:Uncharacterized protein n=1 Tax=Tanacetum coccineum TaxID=301880 RepID=A0ABQ4X1B0_9ASTR